MEVLAGKGSAKVKALASTTTQSAVQSQTATVAVRGYHRAHEPNAATFPRPSSNQAMQRMLRARSIQAKLTVSTPNDQFEQEADRVADQVMRMSSAGASGRPPSIQRACSSCNKELEANRIQRMCKECDEEVQRKRASDPAGEIVQRVCDDCEDELQRQEGNHSAPEMTAAIESQIRGLQSGGEPLAAQTRSFFEPRFGRDFSDVRVHADAPAAATAQSVNALAYTRDNHIVFGAGQYQPNTSTGRRLLAHELTHVVQQGATRSTPLLQRQAILSQAPPGLDATCDLIPNVGPASGGLDFLFAIDSSTFTPTAAELTSLTNFVNRFHDAGSFDDIQVEGFASNDGAQGRNWTLSCERAEALKTALIARGISAARIKKSIAHGASTVAPTAAGNRRAVISFVPRPTVTPTPLVPRTTTAESCPQSVSIELSRGNDDQLECQYQDAVILATLVLDTCACAAGGGIPIEIRFNAVLDGKSFSNAAGTIRETQASTIGQRFFLREEGTANDSPTLVHSGDIGRPGDPDDTLDTRLTLLQTLDCRAESSMGRVLVTNGSFIQQVITWSATADSTGVQLADIDVQQRQVPGRVLPPLRPIGSPYPPFPGVPRDNRCTCHPVTGIHQGTSCPPQFRTGSSVGGP